MIAVVDYGIGNIRAFLNIYKKLNIDAKVARTPQDILSAGRLILPGVGAFDWAMQRLYDSGLREALDESVLVRKVPVLGICVGMQMMACSSEEGELNGLGWVDAEVKLFDVSGSSNKLPLPHMGWNNVQVREISGLFKGMSASEQFYFLHSFYFSPCNRDQILAETEYNGSFASCVRNNNVYGVQFHPEKSHNSGIQLLKNFAQEQ